MDEAELITKLEQTKEKLYRALRRSEGLKAKSSLLREQYTDAKEREKHAALLVMELLERQRELNVMLNRANIMLNRAHEAMALTSVEFNEMAKALPEPKKTEWSDRLSKINDLFKKTGIPDGDLLSLDGPAEPSLESDEIKRESKQAFSRQESIWNRKEKRQAPTVQAELVPEEDPASEPQEAREPEIKVLEPMDSEGSDPESPAKPDRKSWWQRWASNEE